MGLDLTSFLTVQPHVLLVSKFLKDGEIVKGAMVSKACRALFQLEVSSRKYRKVKGEICALIKGSFEHYITPDKVLEKCHGLGNREHVLRKYIKHVNPQILKSWPK